MPEDLRVSMEIPPDAAFACPATSAAKTLAERMGIEAMTLCGYLDGLEAHGLIVRVADPDDRRAKQIHLTDAAEPALQVILNISKDIRAAVSRSMSAQEWDAINALLKSIRNNLAEAAPDCSPSHMDSHKK